MRVRLLGPVDVMSGDEVRPVSGLRRKAVLATLALQAGEVVSTGRLVNSVWSEAAPAARNTLQSHVSYLRTVLGKAAIVARPPGYLLDLGEDGTDVQLAERLLRQGAQSADPGRAAADLREALALWRGQAAGRPGRAGLDGTAGGAAGPAPRADQARAVPGEAGRRGAPAADTRTRADGRRPPARRADPRPADDGAVPRRAAGRRPRRLPAAASHPGRPARAGAQPGAA